MKVQIHRSCSSAHAEFQELSGFLSSGRQLRWPHSLGPWDLTHFPFPI